MRKRLGRADPTIDVNANECVFEVRIKHSVMFFLCISVEMRSRRKDHNLDIIEALRCNGSLRGGNEGNEGIWGERAG